MAVYKQPKSNNWSYKFMFNGELIRQTTKQANKRVAEQMEAAHRTALAKGEVGIRERKPAPMLGVFANEDFLPFVRATLGEKPQTVRFYKNSVRNLSAFDELAKLPLDKITADVIARFVAHRRKENLEVSTVNRDLATLRRMFHLAQEWGRVSVMLPRVKMLPGENRRERVLNADEEILYLNAATELGKNAEEAYHEALRGIRATVRGQQPRTPDAYLLRDVACVLIDCGLRPEECFRLHWSDIRDGAIEIHKGKGRGSRRRIPASQRVLSILEMRRDVATSEWIFPADTKSGHVEPSTLKKQHRKAMEIGTRILRQETGHENAWLEPFVLYTLRHTCLTRWAKHMDPYTLHVLAGHTDMNTTKRYVHPSDADVLEAIERAREVEGGHTFGHTKIQRVALARSVPVSGLN